MDRRMNCFKARREIATQSKRRGDAIVICDVPEISYRCWRSVVMDDRKKWYDFGRFVYIGYQYALFYYPKYIKEQAGGLDTGEVGGRNGRRKANDSVSFCEKKKKGNHYNGFPTASNSK